ncbi:MAG: beta-glucuronidase [Oscillospiraceae bacterium]
MTEKFDLSGKWDYKLINTENTEISSGSTTLPSTVSQMKLSPLNEERIDGYLGDPYKFEGKIVYSRKISLRKPNADEDFFLTLERTRISEVYINGKLVGTQNSLCTSHRYNITDFIAENENVVTITVSNIGYPVPGGHMTSPDTQTNWLGILGEISVTSENKLRAEKIRVFPKLDESSIVIKGKMTACGDVTVQVDGFKAETFTADGDFEYKYKLDGAKPWNEFEHNIYTLKVSCGEDVQTVDFGMKKYETNGRKLLVNGERAFLRGKHDGMIFPMTGAAPMDKASWLKVMKTAKEHGINHYRFHTCCPPKAAFEAADELGIYMEPELPFWGTVEEELNDGQRYLIEEGYRILDEFGSHPSFFALSLGNELWGSKERLNEILLGYKAHDSRHLYTQGSNNFQFIPCVVEGDDLFVGVRFSHDRLFRGSYAMCDAPLGHIQTAAPNSNYNYDEIIAPNAVSDGETKGGTIEIQYGTGVKTVSLGEGGSEFIPEIPVISHEVGQYFMYPDYNEIAKYTGVLKPYNFEIFRERLERAGLLHLADSYFKASGRFAAECYKNEIETALRSDELSGFQLLDLQDFTGQGTALVGILNSFMESKGVISPEEWRGFCSDRVILGVLPKFVWSCGDEIEMPVMLYNYSAAADVDPNFRITLEADGKAYGYELAAKGSFKSGIFTLGTVKLTIPTLEKAAKARLTLETDGIRNGYDLWIFPEVTELPTCAETDWAKAKARLSNGEAVLFMPDKLPESKSIEGTYCTDFWNYSMFNSISVSMKKPSPVGTLGLLVDKDNAALNGFPSEIYSTAQWYDAVEDSRTAILDGLPIEPIVRTIDTNARNHSLGTIFEARTGGGRLLVCTARLDKKPDSIPCRQLYKSLSEYVNSESFKPTAEISLSELDKIFKE